MHLSALSSLFMSFSITCCLLQVLVIVVHANAMLYHAVSVTDETGLSRIQLFSISDIDMIIIVNIIVVHSISIMIVFISFCILINKKINK